MQNEPQIPSSGDNEPTGLPVVEISTGIEFPPTYNGFQLVGVGVRVKYVMLKVYAIGTYLDPASITTTHKGSPEDIENALLDPTVHRTIRIVMYREVDMETCIAAILEALEPRMQDEDMDKLEEFKKLNPPDPFVEGATIEMTVKGDTLVYKNVVGDVGTLKSQRFAEAVCDVYYGSEPISPTHKESVVEGLSQLRRLYDTGRQSPKSHHRVLRLTG